MYYFRQRIITIIVFFFYFFIFLSPAVAAMSLTISDVPSNLSPNEEFEVLVSLNGAPEAVTYYLQIAFTAPEKAAYFGYTQKNDNTWFKYQETFDNFYQITTNQEGSWSGSIRGKPDSEDKDFKGSGNYILKVGRYTATGKSHYWSDNSLTLFIQAPPATPTPASTLVPTFSPRPIATSTVSPIPKPKAQNLPTQTIKSQPTVLRNSPIVISATTAKIRDLISPIETQEGKILGDVIYQATESGGKDNTKVLYSNSQLATAKAPIMLYFSLLIISAVFIMIAVVMGIRRQSKQKKDRN